MTTVNLSTLLESGDFVGYTGSQGAPSTVPGPTGPSGPAGYTGSTGAGYTGSAGGAGYTGSVGFFSGSTDQAIITSNTTPTTSTAVGALVVAGGAGIQGNLVVGGELYVFGNIIPATTETVNLGSPTRRFNTLYIAANTIDIGGSRISTSGEGDIKFNTGSGDVVLNSNAVSFLSNVSTGAPAGVARGVVNLHQADALTVLTGTSRWYAPYDIKIESITSRLGTPANDYVLAKVNKNNSVLFTSNIPAAANIVSNTVSHTMTVGDFLTVDVAHVGTAVATGRDLYVQIKYTYEA